MNILINYSMNIFPKYKFSHIPSPNFDTEEIFFGALEHAEKVYKWFFIVKSYTVVFVKFFSLIKKITMRFKCLILIFIGSAMGFRRFWRHYHDGGRINRIISVGWPIMIRIKLKFWFANPFFRRWFFNFIQYKITKPCAWWERWWY